MKKNIVNVLDIGSQNINLLSGTVNSFGGLVVLAKAEEEYAGFMDGEFFQPEALTDVIASAIEKVELAALTSVKELIVGVPAEFGLVQTKKIDVSFTSKKKLTDEFLKELYSKDNMFACGCTPVNVAPIYNILDDERKVVDATGQKVLSLQSVVSVTYVKTDFIDLFNSILKKLGIHKVEYVLSAQCSGANLSRRGVAERGILIDVGYLTTSVSLFEGDGLHEMLSFSLGGGHIMADLNECLGTDLVQSEILKRKLVLTLKQTSNEVYEVVNLNQTKQVQAKLANQIATARIEMIGQYIDQCLKTFEQNDLPIYLIGGGITYIKGAKEIVAGVINKEISVVLPSLEEFSKPHNFSQIALLEYFVEKNLKKSKRMLANLFNL